MLTGKKTYILVILGLIAALALYIQGVVEHGFSFPGLLQFINGEAAMAAVATLRLAIGKNK